MVNDIRILEFDVPIFVSCDGTSLWEETRGMVGEVNRIKVRVDADAGWALIDVYHTFPTWRIYTDGGFEVAVSKILSDHIGRGVIVYFTEYGMQDNGIASMEGGNDDDTDILIEWVCQEKS